jgi:hypothetical protein
MVITFTQTVTLGCVIAGHCLAFTGWRYPLPLVFVILFVAWDAVCASHLIYSAGR